MTDTAMRVVLGIVSFCFLVIAVANAALTGNARWFPDVVAALSVVAALLIIWLCVDPGSTIAYRFGGTAAFGALLFRVVSVAAGFIQGDEVDAVPLAMGNAALTLMLIVLYGRWWLEDVAAWQRQWRQHRDHR
jgi:hypothetical protein